MPLTKTTIPLQLERTTRLSLHVDPKALTIQKLSTFGATAQRKHGPYRHNLATSANHNN